MEKYTPNWSSLDSRPTPSWFEDSKFGIFIHWGVYAVPAWSTTARDGASIYDRYAEHYWTRLMNPQSKVHKEFKQFHETVYGKNFKYPDFASQFKAELFNPDEWAGIFKQSGAKYIVLTSKHHEGFALWPSQHSWNWNAMDVGPHRDLVGDLTTAVRKKDLKMGFYYSLYEWFNPLYQENVSQYVDEHMIPQMKDLVTKYAPDVLWTDGEWDHPSETWKSTQFLSWLFNESSVGKKVVVNDRWGKETRSLHGGIYTTEYDLIHTGEAENVQFTHPWEECRGIGGSFGYNRKENLEDYSSSKQVIDILIDKVARGGNLLLNIGPTADGRIPVIMQQRLYDIGDWLKVNGEGIYETRAWAKSPKVNKETQVYFTQKGKDLYAIARSWLPELEVKGVASGKVSLLGYNGKIKANFKGNSLVIVSPNITPATIPCQYAWVYKIENALP